MVRDASITVAIVIRTRQRQLQPRCQESPFAFLCSGSCSSLNRHLLVFLKPGSLDTWYAALEFWYPGVDEEILEKCCRQCLAWGRNKGAHQQQ